ncbi:MAG TPA: tetratricopeptide repeat protein, partial [Gemmataceae bacterium]|nr:tetratricopeptide repeat protein [Gemmataceae bacterium]
ALSFRKALELNPRSPDTLAGLGSALWRAGKKQEAANAFREALEINPKEAQAWNGLGVAELAKGNLDRAIEFLAKAVQYNPHWPKGYSDLGLALVRKGQAAEGIKKHQSAVQLAEQGEKKLADMGATAPTPDSIPEIVLYRCRLAHGLHQLGYTQLAVEEYRAALKRDPQWPDKFTAKAWGLAVSAKTNGRDPLWGMELVEQACQAVSAPTAVMLDTLAAAQAALGRFPEAVQNAQRALAIALKTGDKTLTNSIRDRLKLYQSGKLPKHP